MMKNKRCVFCEVVDGRDSQVKRVIKESDDFMAMLVSHPVTEGHFIVFPKEHFSEILDMKDLAEKMIRITIKWAEEMTARLKAKAYVLKLNNKLYKLEDDPLHVGHVHMHVVPRYTKSDLKDSKVLKEAGGEYFDDLIKQLK